MGGGEEVPTRKAMKFYYFSQVAGGFLECPVAALLVVLNSHFVTVEDGPRHPKATKDFGTVTQIARNRQQWKLNEEDTMSSQLDEREAIGCLSSKSVALQNDMQIVEWTNTIESLEQVTYAFKKLKQVYR